MFTRKAFLFVFSTALLLSLSFMLRPTPVLAECNVTHVVTRGQNLFRISLRYGVSMQSIAAANSIANINRIYVGQSLFIPCAGSTGTPVPGATTVPVVPTLRPTLIPTLVQVGTPGVVDCAGFRATSPLDGFPDGPTTFYWDSPRSGAAVIEYQVIVLNDRGARIAGFTQVGGILNVDGDVAFNAIGGRSRFSWYVIALVHGVEVCRTQTTTLNRDWNPNAGLSPSR
jgi:murein DD-endopeptidase MepM/ murein hydrolase activator NlpD